MKAKDDDLPPVPPTDEIHAIPVNHQQHPQYQYVDQQPVYLQPGQQPVYPPGQPAPNVYYAPTPTQGGNDQSIQYNPYMVQQPYVQYGLSPEQQQQVYYNTNLAQQQYVQELTPEQQQQEAYYGAYVAQQPYVQYGLTPEQQHQTADQAPYQGYAQQHQYINESAGVPIVSRLSEKEVEELTGRKKNLFGIPPHIEDKIEKYLCCCCPKSRKGRFICGGVTLVVLIIVGVLLGIYFPRMPQIKVYDIDLSNIFGSDSPYQFTVDDPANPNYNQMNFKMNLTMHVGTYNPNPYDMYIDKISLKAYMVVNTSVVYSPYLTTPLISYGSLVKVIGYAPTKTDPNWYGNNNSLVGTSSYGSIVFPAKSTVNFTMLFLLDYTPDKQLGLLSDPTVLEIASACGVTSKSNTRRKMTIHYDAESVIPALQPIGFKPVLSNDLGILCPFSQIQIDTVIRNVQSGMSVIDALHSVFGGGGLSPALPPPAVQVPDATSAVAPTATADPLKTTVVAVETTANGDVTTTGGIAVPTTADQVRTTKTAAKVGKETTTRLMTTTVGK
ncbi:hypothetical protein BCR33DRAFT_712550 [Rhizoclosmatium globosum]|uniref:Uncharacterized protein n=1 Tax=Rhizoclosmatium globosum TaxID=329046 RepID=A0A1Y2CWU9_9FUNG|nr:hypothetical protein BCR33DRAFT_712550 [Rhizoclosmatium globosum]|eukprot:ORY51511.1 hypothetical protein BCR33DRAFT_712550 [Rhizoclosmatium globosum]